MNKKRILLVDDDLLAASAVRDVLKPEGCEVRIALSGEKALAGFEAAAPFDLVLLDLDLGPGRMDGMEAARRIRDLADIPIVFLSDHPGPDAAACVRADYRFGFVAKTPGWEAFLPAAVASALERHDIEAKNRRDMDTLRAFVEAFPEPAFLVRADGVLLMANKAFLNESGRPAEEAEGRDAFAGFPADAADRGRAKIREALAAGSALTAYEEERGERRYRFLIFPAPAPLDGPDRAAVIRLDITEAHRRAEDLRRAEEFYRTLAECLPEAVIGSGPDGAVRFANRAAAELLGFEHPSEISGTPLWDLVSMEARPETEGFVRAGLGRGDAVVRRETTMVRRAGTPFAAEIAAALRLEGSSGAFVLTARDITEPQKAEALAAAGLQEKTALLKDIRQRIKSNLAAISSLLNLESERLHDSRDREFFRMMKNRVRSMALIYERFYRPEDVHGIDARACFEILVRQVFDSYSPRAGQIRLRMRLESFPLDLKSSIAFGLIVTELVSNSIKHAFPGGRKGTLEIQAEKRGEDFFLAVRDDGIGFDIKALGREADGFGLKLVRSQVEQMKGVLKIETENGTLIEIEVPSL
ncbi:MAG: PAS domain S-box protein [Acidobacteriota bacterium]|nr:PAS domain S-box protein [Acidobacteriota bacterium]